MCNVLLTKEEVRGKDCKTLRIEPVIETITVGAEYEFKSYGLLITAQEDLWQNGLDNIIDTACLETKKKFKSGDIDISDKFNLTSEADSLLQMCVAYFITPHTEKVQSIKFLTSYASGSEPQVVIKKRNAIKKLDSSEIEKCMILFLDTCARAIERLADKDKRMSPKPSTIPITTD